MFDIESKSIEILTSRDGIRSQLVDYAKEYLELENVDLHYTSFLSYMINVLSILSANQLYYTSSIYKEFFLTESQLEESVYNLSKWIGYNPSTALPATVDVVITIPMSFKNDEVNFMVPSNFQVKSGDIVYTTNMPLTIKFNKNDVDNEYQNMEAQGINIKVLNNRSITVRNIQGFFYPVLLNSDNNTASFIVPFTQYEIQEFTFQVPEDLEIYQFWSVKFEFTGMPWKIEVYEVIQNNTESSSTLLKQAESNSLYTMTSTEKRYVFNSGYNKGEIFFGNGVIGKQPSPGSTIKVDVYITQGEKGRVISGILTESVKLYYQIFDSTLTPPMNKTLPIKISVVNPGPAKGGEDSPSISEIKSRAISNLKSKNRFVSEDDYNEIEYILPNVPLTDAIAVLKRSDIKVNEIMLFTKLKYRDMIVPSRNVVVPMDSTSIISTDYIESGTQFDVHGELYETIFSLKPNVDNDVCDYHYVIREVNTTPVLENVSHYAQYSYIIITGCNFKKVGDKLIITVRITNIPDQIYDFECLLTTSWDGNNYNMFSEIDVDSNLVGFSYEINDYKDVPLGNKLFKFKISGMVPQLLLPTGTLEDIRYVISMYNTSITIRKDITEFMMSSITTVDDISYIHNVPVVKSLYFITEEIDRNDFELNSIQELINNIDINSKRMLTDYINIKLSDTTGLLTNMNHNIPILGTAISKTQTIIPVTPTPIDHDQWIVNGTEDPSWFQYQNYIAVWYVDTGWYFKKPNINDSIYVEDEDSSYVYTGSMWIKPIFNIPFNIQAIITKDELSLSSASQIIHNIKESLLNNFVSLFGIDKNIDRSQIIATIRNVSGVKYVNLIKPEIDIKFTYKIPFDLPLNVLLDYTPQLVAFTYDSINISVKDE